MSGLLVPVVPTTIYAIGLNYREHAVEMDKPIPEHPVLTMKSPTALLDPGGGGRGVLEAASGHLARLLGEIDAHAAPEPRQPNAEVSL